MKQTILTILATVLFFTAAARTPKDVAREKNYPVRYCAVTDTAEQRAALIAELWRHDPAAETRLWPEGRVPLKTNDRPLKNCEHELWQRNLVVTDINDPFFTFYPAPGEGVKPVVVILPGGGYSVLGWNKEGTEVADWLNSLGFSAAVLLYRAPDQRDAALCDTQRAISILRRDARRYGVDPGSVGVIGFSAGANLAIRAATNGNKRFYVRVDDADDFPCRPDFQMPIYPWDIRFRNDPATPWKGWQGMAIRPEYPVDATTPPAFIAQAADDFCEIATAVTYDYHLRLAGVSSTIRIYDRGGHGYGLRKVGNPCDVWSDEAAAWLARFKRPSKRVLFLGDSITDRSHVGCEKNYWGFLGERFGFEPIVYGVNGQRMGDIRDQAARYAADHPGECPDVIFVFAGTNDFNGGVPLGEWFTVADAEAVKDGDTVTLKRRVLRLDADTFRGAVNRSLLFLRENLGTARIVLLTPVHRGSASFGERNIQPDETFANTQGLFLDDYVAAIKEAGNLWATKVVDLHSASGIYPLSRAQDAFIHRADTDRLHPSTAGHARIAEAVALEVGNWLER